MLMRGPVSSELTTCQCGIKSPHYYGLFLSSCLSLQNQSPVGNVCGGGNHFDQYEEGQLELEQASLDKPIESDIIYFLSLYDVLSQRHTKICTVCGWRRERKERERGGLLTRLEWLFLLLRYYLWRGAEGRAAASHISSHIRGKNGHIKRRRQLSTLSPIINKTRTPDLIVFGKSMPKEEGGRLFLYRQVTMKVCHQVKPSAQTEDLEDLVTHVFHNPNYAVAARKGDQEKQILTPALASKEISFEMDH
ncbi:G patch domain-containing protein 8 [Collichthys lucidus]|uniref:G patch domain-containing protein 8 n=1 Tax=Collichthys lucidus TaxID=240159 RepID=A0A4U5VTZ0_COLLU|nr:G patch domain-containing protein 8 [Collichthys lucidus]